MKSNNEFLSSINEFIDYAILCFFAKYRNAILSDMSGEKVDNIYQWDEMILLSDPDKKHGVEYWICMVKLWGIDDPHSIFVGEYIHNKISGSKNEISDLTSKVIDKKDREVIMSLACTMSFMYKTKPEFYESLRESLSDYIERINNG